MLYGLISASEDDIHSWLVVVYRAHVMSGKQAWYGAVPLMAARIQMPEHINYRRQCVSCRLPVEEGTDALRLLTSFESEDISLDSAHNTED
jgi:hypothetical protein